MKKKTQKLIYISGSLGFCLRGSNAQNTARKEELQSEKCFNCAWKSNICNAATCQSGQYSGHRMLPMIITSKKPTAMTLDSLLFRVMSYQQLHTSQMNQIVGLISRRLPPIPLCYPVMNAIHWNVMSLYANITPHSESPQWRGWASDHWYVIMLLMVWA